MLPKQNEAVLVRLVDAYPNEWPPLAHKVLTSEAGALLPVRRDQECDRPFGEILLRTAPGVAAVSVNMERVSEGEGQLESTARDQKKEGISDHG